MDRPTRKSALSLNDYIKVLQQLHRTGPRPQSVLTVLRSRLRVSDSWPQLAVAERIATALTSEQRRAPGRASWPEREVMASAAGTPLREVDRLILDFDAAAEVFHQYLGAGPMARLTLLVSADPLLAWLRRCFRPSPPIAARSDEHD
ncbi:MAG: hypothetical protein U0790_13030 [Isosphaeraceae bacterium]